MLNKEDILALAWEHSEGSGKRYTFTEESLFEFLNELKKDQATSQDEALREKADKYAIIERVMEVLECDEREGGIWTACTLLLISSAHKMNSAKSVVDQEGVTAEGENLGNWRVTVERIDTAMHGCEGCK